jgi:hypothetical protein
MFVFTIENVIEIKLQFLPELGVEPEDVIVAQLLQLGQR